jgi:hypothetical protein
MPLHVAPFSRRRFGARRRCRLARGLAFARHPQTTFRQQSEQHARGVDHGPPVALNSDKSGVLQTIKVECERFDARLSA